MKEHYTQRHYEDFSIEVKRDKTKPTETLYITDGLDNILAVEDIDKFIDRIRWCQLVERKGDYMDQTKLLLILVKKKNEESENLIRYSRQNDRLGVSHTNGKLMAYREIIQIVRGR
jgi:hypothetical protein